MSLENGKALPDARGEVAYAAEFFRWYSGEAVRINGEPSTDLDVSRARLSGAVVQAGKRRYLRLTRT